MNAGSRTPGPYEATEWSLQHERGLSTDVGSTRTQHQLRIDPNEVRRLPAGMGFVIGDGKGQKVQIAAAPRTDGEPDRIDVASDPERPPDDHHPEPDEPIRL